MGFKRKEEEKKEKRKGERKKKSLDVGELRQEGRKLEVGEIGTFGRRQEGERIAWEFRCVLVCFVRVRCD